MCKDMYWVIFNSNIRECAEYFSSFFSWMPALMTFAYIACGIFLLLTPSSKVVIPLEKNKGLFGLSLLLIVSIFSFQYLVKAIPFLDFYKSGITYIGEAHKMNEEMNLRKKHFIQVDRKHGISPGKRVFVVIIGESLSTEHMGIYGYCRNTTPQLCALKSELDIFTDVVTCDTHTIGVLKKVLTFADHDHPDWYIMKPSIVEVFNSAGFETYWISNQELVSKWGGNYGVIAREAHHTYDLSLAKKNDEIVLPQLNEILKDTVTKDKIIFIHLMGNHHQYSCRYPDNFSRFNHKKDLLPPKDFADKKAFKIIDEYDNSVLYSDSIIATIIRKVKAQQTSAFTLFFSDHGEEVYDYRNAVGHFMTNVYPSQCRIPFILWRSEKYKKEFPSIVIDQTRPFSTEHLIYALSDLSEINFEGNQPTQSIFSPNYTPPHKRWVGEEDYDREVLSKINC